ncbi:ribonuclease H family protein [Streptomyces acidiscabies]|uniref:Ribonuclease H n=1 Tax=Streptomyces acidiscabies TaxID=42234 RepID=A0AAP6BFB1_9ACTN|nr:ribonuclease H [Streptomyces acidiscabies]MBP5934763.1 ribonuclease HI [Streptomyces sp. LBUM 1476]MBZ3917499.1 ribonuclease HI [Streptomyces acidiscabies]MDX2963580.1 ribonuclease HI [Streptomyces acidiscabies]MDX3018877.1 ribonuclease HI [Streptomyces acidiscabies]MDX3790451.1 ribonuclease HI [Streptomyces acidiscabies]
MIESMRERLVAACDGASKGNPGPAAWAWVVSDDASTPVRWEAGPLGKATNNVAELTALERLLTATDPDVPLEVRMDSQYAMKAVTTWLPGWKRNGWKTSGGKPVANQELVVRIDELLGGRTVEFRYVPAHQVDGDPLNDFADRAASQAAIVQEAAGSELGSPEPPPSSMTPSSGGGARRGGKPAARKTAGSSSRTLKAKFPGRCLCGRSYAAGEDIAKNAQGWGHPECRAEATG